MILELTRVFLDVKVIAFPGHKRKVLVRGGEHKMKKIVVVHTKSILNLMKLFSHILR